MTLQAFVYAAQQHLQAATGQSFKRTHLYELLAASFGFHSYAALNAHAVFAQRPRSRAGHVPTSTGVRQRCLGLGYPPAIADQVSSTLAAFVVDSRITVLNLTALVSELRDDLIELEGDPGDDSNDDASDGWSQGEWAAPLDLVEPILLESLEAAADKNVALAHYALVLIHDPDHNENSHNTGSAYWYAQAQQGQELTGAPKDWADAYAAHLARTAKHAHHLREAARLGEPLALLDLADRSDDPAFFEQGHTNIDADPAWVASLAQRLGRKEDASRWLTLAAEAGDTEAMRELIETHDAGNLMRCWTWVYLAGLLGTDLTEDEYYAVYEDGSPYDDDVGGPAYAEGRDGIELAPLDAKQDRLARQAATDIFSQMQEND